MDAAVEGSDGVSGVGVDPCPLNRCGITYEVVGVPEVTLADLVSFVPARPTVVSEPAGVGIVGMPVNLVAAASEQSLPGRLFDCDVIVRFTPVGYEFDHGDGTLSATPTGGQSWDTLGQGQFTRTPTSHAYPERGRYTVTATVLYAADVDFGTGWRPVAGYVRATADDYTVRVVEVHTALVQRTCTEDPHGPGC